MNSVKYRPEIDGLRAVAVIPVILFHLGVWGTAGGFLGVDVFFVISGFLITSILIQEQERGRFAYSEFWLRRVRRIFPAFGVMLIATLTAGHIAVATLDTQALGKTGLAALCSLANVELWRLTGDYWGAKAESSPLLHTWSLSVEEQFYFVYPLFLGLAFRFARKHVFALTAVGAIISFAAYVGSVGAHPDAAFYLLPTRAWELGSGCLLALAQWKYAWKPRSNPVLALLGLAAIAASYGLLSAKNAFPGSVAIVVLGAVLVLAFAPGPDGSAHRFLASAPLVFIGKISYSLYLWHWPVIVLSRMFYASRGEAVPLWMLLSAIAGISIASFYLVEQRARRCERIVPPALATFGIGFACACFLIADRPQFDLAAYSPVIWDGRRYDATPVQQEWSPEIKRRMEGIQVVRRDPAHADAYKTRGILKRYGDGRVDVAVLGDSHALMWAGVLDQIAQELNLDISFFTADGCSPFVPLPLSKPNDTANWRAQDRYLFEKTKLDRIRQWKPGIVLLLTRWADRTLEETEDLMRFLKENQCQVMTIEQPPELFFGDAGTPRQLASMRLLPLEQTGQFVRMGNKENYRRGQQVTLALEEKYPFFHSIKIADLFLGAGDNVLVLEDDRILYIDDDHLSRAGAAKAKDRIRSALEGMLARVSVSLRE